MPLKSVMVDYTRVIHNRAGIHCRPITDIDTYASSPSFTARPHAPDLPPVVA